MKFLKLLFVILALSAFASGARAELQDQGLKSIMDIIDKAIAQLGEQTAVAAADSDPAELENALQQCHQHRGQPVADPRHLELFAPAMRAGRSPCRNSPSACS